MSSNMAQMSINEEDVSEGYEQFRSIPVETWEKEDAEEIVEHLRSEGHDELDASDVSASLRLMGKVAHEYDEETFSELMKGGEIPPVEMSQEEMELARGGWVGAVAAYVLTEAAHGIYEGIKDHAQDPPECEAESLE